MIQADNLVEKLEKSNEGVLKALSVSIISISDFKFSDTYFSSEEIGYYKGKVSSLAARYAAKLSICRALGRDIPYKEISILASQSGEPVLSVSGGVEGGLAFSITHEDDLAAALVVVARGKNQVAVGLDATLNSRMEAVAKQPDVLRRILTKDELKEVHSAEDLAKVWSGKEAISKALGIGIWHGGFLQKIEIFFKGDETRIVLYDEMLEIEKRKGISRWDIDFVRDEKFTVACVLGF